MMGNMLYILIIYSLRHFKTASVYHIMIDMVRVGS
jgi:hypothetical protein